MAAFVIPEIKLTKEDRAEIASTYARLLSETKEDRDRRMKEVWALALKNYEGKVDQIDFPWTNSNNSFVALTPSYTDAWSARLRNAGTAQDPVYRTEAWGEGDIVDGVTAQEYAEVYQQVSKWLEDEEIPNDLFMEEITTVLPKYGNAVAYIPWEHMEVANIQYDPTGEIIRNPDGKVPVQDLLDKPVVHTLHPKNFYMDVEETNVQTAAWCGIDEYFTPDDIRRNIKTKNWNKKAAEAVLKFHSEKTEAERRKKSSTGTGTRFKLHEDGTPMQDEYRKELKRSVSMPDRSTLGVIELQRVWAWIDTDGDGVVEHVEMLLHHESGNLLSIRHLAYAHGKRPLVLFAFRLREGTWMALGIPEMLFNSQRIMNEIMRDMLDNNKTKNTSVFVAKAGTIINPDEPMFPGKVLEAENPSEDLVVLPMGTGVPSTSLEDLSIIQAWAERRTGMTDFNLGRERSSRTPATTILALLEEGSELVTATVRRQRRGQVEIWTQVHQLYAQRGDAPWLDRILSEDEAALIRKVWQAIDIEDIRKKLILKADVTTQNLNRAIKRQEAATLMGQLDAHHQRLLGIMQMLQQTDVPEVRALLISMAKSSEVLMERILNTYDIKEQSDMNPKLASVLGTVPPSQPVAPEGGGGSADPSAQVDQAVEQPVADPINAPGRPAAGMPRTDGGGGDNQHEFGG